MKKINLLLSILLFLIFIPLSYAHQFRSYQAKVRVNLDQTESKLIDYYASNVSFPTSEMESPYGLQYLNFDEDEIPIDPFGNTEKVSLIPTFIFLCILLLICISPIILTVLCIYIGFFRKREIRIEIIALNIMAWLLFLLANPFTLFYFTINTTNILIDHSSLEYHANLEKEKNKLIYYVNTLNGDALIGSPGPDFNWQIDLPTIPSKTTEQLKSEMILYDMTNGMVSSGDMIRIIHKPVYGQNKTTQR